MKKLLTLISVSIFLITIGILLSGCNEGTLYGKELTGMKLVKVNEILKNPASFEGKSVRLKGKIVLECTSGCWFNLQDDTGLIYIELNPAGIAIPQKVGSIAIVEGKVETYKGKLMIIAKGLVIK